MVLFIYKKCKLLKKQIIISFNFNFKVKFNKKKNLRKSPYVEFKYSSVIRRNLNKL